MPGSETSIIYIKKLFHYNLNDNYYQNTHLIKIKSFI